MIRKIVGGTLLAGAGIVGWSYLESRRFQRSFHTLPILPEGVEPLRVLNISDLHFLPDDRLKVEFVRSLADLGPDAVFLTGDQLNAADVLPTLLHALKPLAGTPGAFVFGSHDYYAPVWKNPLSYLFPAVSGDRPAIEELPHGDMVRAYADNGWADLRNTRGSLSLKGLEISLVGVDDPHIDRDRYPAGGPDSDFAIGLTHAPYTRVLDAMAGEGVDLALAGHTHGGQICVPGYGALVTNCDLDTDHVAGVFGWPLGQDPTMTVAISRGLGTSRYVPLRLACLPEVQVLDLVGVTH